LTTFFADTKQTFWYQRNKHFGINVTTV